MRFNRCQYKFVNWVNLSPWYRAFQFAKHFSHPSSLLVLTRTLSPKDQCDFFPFVGERTWGRKRRDCELSPDFLLCHIPPAGWAWRVGVGATTNWSVNIFCPGCICKTESVSDVCSPCVSVLLVNQWNELGNESMNPWNALRPVWALMTLTSRDNFFLRP